MRHFKLLGLAAAVLAGICLLSTSALSQEKAGDKAPAGGMDDAMKQFEAMAAPGPHHKALEAMAGNFKYTSKFRMDPTAEWMSSDGVYEGEMGLGGRFLLTTSKGQMMGSEFIGMGCVGYDNMTKKHVSAWIDNMGTGIMRTEGTCDDACKKLTFEGEMLDPMTGKMAKYKYEFEIISNDEFRFHWFGVDPAGKMFEAMNMVYTRVK